MLTDKFGCQLVSEYLMNKSLCNMKRMIKVEQNTLCKCECNPADEGGGWEPIHVATQSPRMIESSREAASFSEAHSGVLSARACEKCITQNKFGRPLALLNEVYERQMEQKLSPVQQRRAQRLG